MSYLHRNLFSGGSVVVAVLALGLALPALAAAPPAADILTSTSSGVLAITFEVPEGEIRLTLPGDMAKGDTVSGAVTLERNTKTPLGHGNGLGQYRITLDQLQVLAAQGALRWAIPSDLATESVPVVLRDPQDLEIARATIPVRAQPPFDARDLGEFHLPRVGQRGGAITIWGPFDGDFATTEVLLAGRKMQRLAESPRALVVETPADLLGAADIVVSEQGLETAAQFRAISIRLTAPEASLRQGARMTATATIEGLDGLDLPIPVVAINRSPEVVTLEGGHHALVRRLVYPDTVLADGTSTLEFNLIGDGTGDFLVSVGVEDTEPPKHVPHVTHPPHQKNVSFPPNHASDITWPEHLVDVSFPAHAKDVTWPDHLVDVSWPSHATPVTWPEHKSDVSWPTHASNVTWPEHVPEVTWMVHRKNYTWVPPAPPKDGVSDNDDGASN